MALQAGEDIYATLLLNDTYLPGALVLAHSLRDAGTAKKLAVLVTLDTVSAEVITQLKNVYDYVIPVPRITNDASPANLHLMNRPDLHSAFTKINLWKQAQFRKIVYIDADVVAYRAPDELFDLPYAFAAAPDIGWPDLFNTGVMVLTPDVGEYRALAALAQRGVSFDGADQGLLNMHFANAYHRLPFTYNVTPSAHYQYLPAYRHFQPDITMVHFIGPDKPWTQGRGASHGGAYDEMVGQWWSVYDRHYRAATPPPSGSNAPAPPAPPEIIQYFVKGEFHPTVTYRLLPGEPSVDLGSSSYGQPAETLPPPPPPSFYAYHEHQQHSPSTPSPPPPPPLSPSSPLPSALPRNDGQDAPAPSPQHAHHDYQHHHHHHHHHQQHHDDSQRHDGQNQPPDHGHTEHVPPPASSLPSPPDTSHRPPPDVSFAPSDETTHTETREDQVPGPGPGTSQPPAPEHKNEPYQPPMEPSWDAQWQPPPAHSKPEAMNFPQTHYEMSRDTTPFVPPPRYASPPRDMWYEVPKEAPAPAHERPAPIFPWETHQSQPTRVFAEPPPPPPPPPPGPEPTHPDATSGSPSMDLKTEPTTPTMPFHASHAAPPSDPWATFTQTNAWDEVPQIERYVAAFQKTHHRMRSRGHVPGGGLRSGGPAGSTHAGPGGVAGVGAQDAYTPWRRGSKVTDFPSEVERPSLPVTPAPIRRPKHWGSGGPSFGPGADDAEGADEHLLPAARGVPQQVDWDPTSRLQKLALEQSEFLLQKLGDTDDQAASVGPRAIPLRSHPFGSEGIRSPTYVAQAPVVSPKPIKPGGHETRSVRNSYNDSGEAAASAFAALDMAQPAYLGPGIAFEKDEGYPQHEVAAALPSEEEMDVLNT